MDPRELKDTLEAHQDWLDDCDESKRADLREADLRRAALYRADLPCVELARANLRGADLRRANLQRANLRGADLTRANLRGAELAGANLREADLREARLTDANLRSGKLMGADLNRAKLKDADLLGANLSGANGLINPAEYIKREFETVEDGVLCYKTFDMNFSAPDYWRIEKGNVVEESVNPLRTLDCGCGVNVATFQWMRRYWPTPREIWRCRIAWPDLAGVVVPYNTDGKIRAERVKLLERIDDL
jgi:hypothetical protein